VSSVEKLVKARAIVFVLAGVAGLVLRSRYNGPWRDFVQSYAGNVAVSFAVYFVILPSVLQRRFSRLISAVGTLLVVEMFEALHGFGLMQNTYDPFDFAANAAGVALAVAVDIAASRIR
jgi:hypothetical protein